MARKPVFYSFHFGNDVMRVQQVRNMGVIDGNEPVSPSEWETVKRKGDAAIQAWIDQNMKYRQCVIVLVGTETSKRPWVKYEIEKAWKDERGLLGIHIHNLKCPNTGTCAKGPNPFAGYGVDGTPLTSIVQCYDPPSDNAYNHIKANLDTWVEEAIAIRKRY